MSATKCTNCSAASISGSIWIIGWLFTIGYVHLPFFWKGVLALIIWPYYLGTMLAVK